MTNKSSAQIGKDVAAQLAQAPEWVYFVMIGTTGTTRRYNASSHNGKEKTECKGSVGQWYTSTLSIAGAKAKIAEGSALLCNEFGSALEEAPKPLERIVTDPETGHQYKLHADGNISRKHVAGYDFLPIYMSAESVITINRLGLLEVCS